MSSWDPILAGHCGERKEIRPNFLFQEKEGNASWSRRNGQSEGWYRIHGDFTIASAEGPHRRKWRSTPKRRGAEDSEESEVSAHDSISSQGEKARSCVICKKALKQQGRAVRLGQMARMQDTWDTRGNVRSKTRGVKRAFTLDQK